MTPSAHRLEQLAAIIPDFSRFRGGGNQAAIGPHNAEMGLEKACFMGTSLLGLPSSTPPQNRRELVVQVQILAPGPSSHRVSCPRIHRPGSNSRLRTDPAAA